MGITGKRMKDVVRRPPARFFNYEIGAELGFSSQLAGSELERPIVSLQLYSVREGDSSPALPSRSAAWTRARPTSFGREHNEDVTSICRLIMVGLCAFAASPQPLPVGQLHYLGEVGHLGTPSDSRTAVQFGDIRITSQGNGSVRISGQDDNRRSWNAVLPMQGGVGWTDVWRADFDRNSRPDLLIAAYFPQNGRCIDEITLSFLLFNDHGQPVPWVIRTRMPEGRRFPAIPAVFADLNHDGSTELVVTDCTYSEPPRFGEDRRITGIYKAKDATWSLIHPADIAPYTALVRHSYRFRPNHDQLLPSDPAHWPDQGNTMDPHGPPPVQLAAVLPASVGCRGVRLPPLVDGVLQADWKDPCSELGKDRLELSNGTICYGWPTVVIDRTDSREIVAEPEQLSQLLQEIVKVRRTVVLAGESDRERCSPTVLWAPRTGATSGSP